MTQYYGVLRVVRVRPGTNLSTELQEKYPSGWFSEERLVHLLTHKETTIGRALNNDLVLLDSTVSREHARLVQDEHGWRVFNRTQCNVVSVNGRAVPGGGNLAVHPQDLLVIGSTTLQLIAPQTEMPPLEEQAYNEPISSIPELLTPPTLDNATHDGHQAQNGTHRDPLAAEQRARDTLARLPIAPASNFITPLPVESSAEVQENWSNAAENLIGIGVTMQFVLARRISGRRFWLLAGIASIVLAVLALVTFIVSNLISVSVITRSGTSTVLLSLIIALVPALGINLLVNFIDRFEREPWFLRLAAFLWGAIIAIPTALLIEHNIDLATLNVSGTNDLLRSLLGGLNAGITEETMKGLGLLLLFLVLRDEFDNVTDGIVYGALIGAGFAMIENFVKFTQYSNDFLPYLIVGRVVLGWLSHSTFTACFGATLGYVRHTRVRWRQIAFPLLGYICAVGLHSVFDFISLFANALVLATPENINVGKVSLIAITGNYVPPFIAQIILLYFLIKALMHEGALIREFLASEVSDKVVMVEEYVLLQNSFQRTRAERQVLWKYGFKQWLRVKALYQTEIGLAFRKWHVSMGDKPKLGYVQPEDAYRRRIRRLREEIRRCEQKKKQAL